VTSNRNDPIRLNIKQMSTTFRESIAGCCCYKIVIIIIEIEKKKLNIFAENFGEHISDEKLMSFASNLPL